MKIGSPPPSAPGRRREEEEEGGGRGREEEKPYSWVPDLSEVKNPPLSMKVPGRFQEAPGRCTGACVMYGVPSLGSSCAAEPSRAMTDPTYGRVSWNGASESFRAFLPPSDILASSFFYNNSFFIIYSFFFLL